ncbi:hypothetical protein LguiA_025545 [Lonicera macranthoides]
MDQIKEEAMKFLWVSIHIIFILANLEPVSSINFPFLLIIHVCLLPRGLPKRRVPNS